MKKSVVRTTQMPTNSAGDSRRYTGTRWPTNSAGDSRRYTAPQRAWGICETSSSYLRVWSNWCICTAVALLALIALIGASATRYLGDLHLHYAARSYRPPRFFAITPASAARLTALLAVRWQTWCLADNSFTSWPYSTSRPWPMQSATASLVIRVAIGDTALRVSLRCRSCRVGAVTCHVPCDGG